MTHPLPTPYLERFASRSVLITGGTGFIGRRLVSLLLAHGARVTLLQRTTDPATSPCDVLLADLGAPDFAEQITAAWGKRHYDAIFNLAAHGVTRSEDSSPDRRRRDGHLAQRVNVDATLALFRHAQASASGVFVQAGTCSEYAPPAQDAPRVETDPLEERDDHDSVIYGWSKARASQALLAASRSDASPLVVARIFNVYGPGEKGQRLLPLLVHNLSHGRHVPLSDGLQIKDYLHLDDVVEGLCALAVTAREREFQGVLNLCSGCPVSVAQFARAVAHTIGDCEYLLGFGERKMHPDEIETMIGSTVARDAFTEWRPQRPLDVGLPSAVQQMITSTTD